jgi:hypothetical protein
VRQLDLVGAVEPEHKLDPAGPTPPGAIGEPY